MRDEPHPQEPGSPKQPELEKPMSMKEMLGFYTDTLKVLGTGNVTGVVAATAGLYYFSSRPPLVAWWIKTAAICFFLGTFLFAVACFLLILATMHFDDFLRGVIAAVKERNPAAISAPETATPKRVSLVGVNVANVLGAICTLCFFCGLCAAFVALVRS
jgi:hypothetical protein